ncbi:MAG: tetratricopeptide repeat protein [Bacillota bacterium]
MFKLTFEKVIIFVLILILLLSTANIYTQYFKVLFADKNTDSAETISTGAKGPNFATMLTVADNHYSAGEYQQAIETYNEVLISSYGILNDKQKLNATFRLAMSYYYLQNYSKAYNGFKAVYELDTQEAIAYNNAAVCLFYMNKPEEALNEMQNAIKVLPIVEYYYNLGRIYEELEQYNEASKYFLAVVIGEENLTSKSLDPVRLKNKVQNLITSDELRKETAKEIYAVLRNKSNKELLVLTHKDMELKSTEFALNTEEVSGGTMLRCKYDRKANDPYNLVNSLQWVVTKSGKEIYKSSKESFSYKVTRNGTYKVTLNLTYMGSKSKLNSKFISITGDNKKKIDIVKDDSTPDKPSPGVYTASYQQLFEKGLDLNKAYVDSYGAVWGKDEVKTEINTVQYRDSGSSLHIINNSDKKGGIWANLGALLDDNNYRGKKITIRFWMRKISNALSIDVSARADDSSVYKPLTLNNKWSQYKLELEVPEDANSLTFSLHINPQAEVQIDGFNIVVTK